MRPHLTIKDMFNSGNKLVIESICPFCRVRQQVLVNNEAFQNWENGELVQNAFPKLTPTEREALMTGICDNCFPS